MRILVVEDTDDSRVLLNDYLEAVGFDVLSAKDGESAYKLLEVSSVDLVVTDILMPKMDGYELCRRIKSSSAIPNIPVIFYTATYTDKRDQELAYRLGASRFLVKPFDLDALLYEINAVLKEEVPSLDDLEERNDIAQIYAQTISEKLGKKVQELDDKKKDADKLTRRIEAINDSLPSLIWELDSELKMLYANRTTQTWFGVEIIQILGQRVTDLFDSSESETILGIYQRFLKGETELCEVELQVGGSRKRVQVQGIPSRDRSGNVLGVYSIITDVTDKHHAELEQRQLEQRLQRGQKLELIGQFTGGIAHDFNNILTIVAGYTGMAMHHLQNSSDDTLKDYIKEIHSARLRGTDIVTHLLAFCRGGESQ
ncbi:MAG: response regulator, partial [Gammaproteobacteria bacterium]|nr:response regulator [Gammaproteobacteria bacterium]